MRPSRLLKASNTQFFINIGSFTSLVNGYHTAALLWLLRNGETVVLSLPKLWGQQPIDWEPLVYRTCCWVLCESMWPGGTAVSTVGASFSIPTNNAERSQSLMQLIKEKSLETENWTNGLNKQGSNKSTLNSPFTCTQHWQDPGAQPESPAPSTVTAHLQWITFQVQQNTKEYVNS